MKKDLSKKKLLVLNPAILDDQNILKDNEVVNGIYVNGI